MLKRLYKKSLGKEKSREIKETTPSFQLIGGKFFKK